MLIAQSVVYCFQCEIFELLNVDVLVNELESAQVIPVPSIHLLLVSARLPVCL